MDKFLQSLRSRTSDQHKWLEQNTASKNLLSSQVTTSDYATYLSLLYGFVKGFEKIVFPSIQQSISDIEDRRKIHLLVSDLNVLGFDEANIPVIPDLFFAEMYHSKAASLGGMYVLEGSVLGGSFIYKHLQSTLGSETIADCANYFTVYGSKTGSSWNLFLQAFCLASHGIEEEIIKSALQTFNILQNWFNKTSLKIIQNET